MHSKELAEGYTLTPVTIFRVVGWGEYKFSLLTIMPIFDNIFLISMCVYVCVFVYVLFGGGEAGYHVAREYNLSGCVYVSWGGIAQP